MSPFARPVKFQDPRWTSTGEPRASVALTRLETLWFNTGTLCNLACANCYIESSPTNDRLAYLTLADVRRFLDEAARERLGLRIAGFTGGEPFMNPEIIAMLELCLGRGFELLVLTNAMRPMRRHEAALVGLHDRFGDRLRLRVSLDHFTPQVHEAERGARSWERALSGLAWLVGNGFAVSLAGRSLAGDSESAARAGYARLFAAERLPLDADDPEALVIFPEMDANREVPEISEACWEILGTSPDAQMCATSRMIVRRKGRQEAEAVACTLLPYDERFALGTTLALAARAVSLNHPHCAQFCVLGGASCGAPHQFSSGQEDDR